MADNLILPNLTWTSGNLSVSNLNAHVRDPLDAYLAALKGDASVDADMWQAPKAGTLAARPATWTAAMAGREYTATDVLAKYWWDGTRFQHGWGRGAFDSFDRTTSSTLGNAESGHPWVEEVGDIQINAGAELENVSGSAIATVDTGGVLHSADYVATLTSGATIGSFDASLVLKYLNTTNYLYVQFNGAVNSIALNKQESGASTLTTATPGVPLAASTAYVVEVKLRGSVCWVKVFLYPGGLVTTLFHDDDEAIMGSYINTASKSGVRLLNTTHSKCGAFSVKPN